MASANQSTLNGRQIQTALQHGAKDILRASGIQLTTRRGKKELTLAVQRLAQQRYGTLDEATQAGQALGKKIAELSKAKGKTDLDGGIVRQLMLTGEIPTVAKVSTKPTKTTPVLMTEPQAQAPEIAPEPIPETVEPAVAEAIAAASEVEPAEVDAATVAVPAAPTVAAAPEVEAAETVDAAIAEAPGLDAIETLEPSKIEAPDPEPATAADTAAAATVESAES